MCPPLTANRIAAIFMENSPGPSIECILPHWGFQRYGGPYGTFCHV